MAVGSTEEAFKRQIYYMDFWSAPMPEVIVTDGAADLAMPSVTISDFPSSLVTVTHCIAMFKFRILENVYAGANEINGIQYIQVRDDAPGTWRDAITIAADMFAIPEATREGGDVIIGDADIALEIVDLDNTYEFQWDDSLADQDGLHFNDIQTGLRVYFTL